MNFLKYLRIRVVLLVTFQLFDHLFVKITKKIKHFFTIFLLKVHTVNTSHTIITNMDPVFLYGNFVNNNTTS